MLSPFKVSAPPLFYSIVLSSSSSPPLTLLALPSTPLVSVQMNDVGSGRLECLNRSGASQCARALRALLPLRLHSALTTPHNSHSCLPLLKPSRSAGKHNGATIRANFTYFFHYRRFCQQLLPMRTLDELLTSFDASATAVATSPLAAPLGTSLAAALPSITVMRVDTGGSECEVSPCHA